MTPKDISRICAALPGSELTHPFGDDLDVWKVSGKMFAVPGLNSGGVTLKCVSEDAALMLIEIGVAKRARYLKRGGWVTVDYDAMQDDDFRQRILDSYATVRKGLTKAQKAALPDIPDQPPQ